MHPRSKHWHMLDYVITRQRYVRSVHITRVMRGTSCWSENRLVRCLVVINLLPPKRRHAPARPRKLNVDMLKRDEVKSQLQVKLDDILACDQQDAMPSVDEDWKHIKDATYQVAADVLGYQVKRHHQD